MGMWCFGRPAASESDRELIVRAWLVTVEMSLRLYLMYMVETLTPANCIATSGGMPLLAARGGTENAKNLISQQSNSICRAKPLQPLSSGRRESPRSTICICPSLGWGSARPRNAIDFKSCYEFGERFTEVVFGFLLWPRRSYGGRYAGRVDSSRLRIMSI